MNPKIIFAFVGLSLVAESFAFKCYVCNSHNDTDCDKYPVPQKYLKDCDKLFYLNRKNNEPFQACRHQIVEKNGKINHDRRCGWKRHNAKREMCLQSADNVVKTTQCECHSEACNSSSSLTVGLLTIVASIFSVLLLRR